MTELLILVGVALSNEENIEQSLEELEELAKTAGAQVVAKIVQNRESIHPTTYVGKGKIEEIKEAIQNLSATGIVCDDELSPAQLKNLEDALSIKVVDRTVMILDIFAQRASTKEGKIQVELAQLKYRATRLTGLGNSLSKLGGGIGTRGPGEKKLEMDRRLIRERISKLKRELEEVKQVRETMRKQREKNAIPVISIVGYTNAGKSTLLNTLTGANVLEEDKLFATLDPTTRSFTLESGQQLLFTDTVGFIRKLPHHLIEAFQSTLEEAKYADIILHIVDSSNEMSDTQMHIVYETLDKLGIKDKAIITAFNKIDKLEDSHTIRDFRADRTVKISAKTGDGLKQLLQEIEQILKNKQQFIEKIFSYEEGNKLQLIRKYGQLLSEEYLSEGVYIKAYIPKKMVGQL